MVITYYGENYFKISSGETSILIDPTNQRSYKGSNLIIFTEKSLKDERVDEGAFIIDHPGEFEIMEISVRGWQSYVDTKKIKTVFRVVFEGISIAIFGNIENEIPAELTEYMKNIDIAITPIGNSKQSALLPKIAKFLRQIEPGIIIPSLSDSDKNLKEFFKEFGEEKTVCEEKLVIKKKDITEKQMKVLCLKAR